MPVCWITGCKFVPGRMHNGHEIKLHSFPNSFQRIKEWLLQLGQSFNDIDNIVKQILESKQRKSNKYRFCSLHFSDDSFIVNACGRTLRPNALPTIFQSVSHTSEKIHEELSLRKTFRRRKKGETSDERTLLHMTAPPHNLRKEKTSNEPSFLQSVPSQTLRRVETSDDPSLRHIVTPHLIKEEPSDDPTLLPTTVPSQNPSPLINPQSIKTEVDDDFPSYTTSPERSIESSSIITKIIKTESYQDAETQTDFTCENSTIHLPGHNLMVGNSAITSCGPPCVTLQNPIVVLNCFINAPGNPF